MISERSKIKPVLVMRGVILAALLLVAGCRLDASPTQPPRPTIVPVSQVTATRTPSPSPTSIPPSTPTPARQGDTLPAAAAATTTPPPPTDTPTPTATPPPTVTPLEAIAIKLLPVVGGFTKPLYATHAGDGSGRLFVVEQPGRILIAVNGAVNPEPFLDLSAIVGSDGYEQGLLGLAFHPDYRQNGLFYVYYTDKQGDSVLARYRVSDDPNRADAAGEVLFTLGQPYANHNGGQLAFGPDGYLYLGLGDGGSANDPRDNAQNLGTLLGKILRLDVNNGTPYGVPDTNPFVQQAEARPEIWSYGWRNPWRFSFDRQTGDMFVADVGQAKYEEVHVEPAGSPGGLNYGWRLLEGAHCFDPAECDPAALGVQLPAAEYTHEEGGCSVTGGYVYRGSRFPALTGIYFYGDFCSGLVWGLRRAADGGWKQAQLLDSELSLSSFGEDEAGEVYVVDHKGQLFQIGN